MASSALTGERRWASVRRSSMTSLGKVSVPKPINLPSQRSENRGLDPNVEVVPKGTLSWGCRPSSAASCAWGSSTLDGGASSPSHLSGRPSSGGSSTRPSTGGSDRANESSANAWGPNSRPSSASGPLTSNQTGTSLRPCSAEPRPGSSQLSRFAEPLSDNSVAWGRAGTVEKLGGASSKKDGFSLTSGDFPTLGYEKSNSGKDLQDHGPHSRPGSFSSVAGPAGDITGDVSLNANAKSEIVNGWRKDSSPYVDDGGAQPGVEKWQGGPQPYPSASIPPQHFDPWHGTPMGGPPGGVWFRGPPGGPPYGTPPVPHGGFHMEPFPYYCPRVPATAVANSQSSLPAASPRGHHPKNSDPYGPPMPKAFIRPGVPIRPGFYHGLVAYEGYYPPPVGYCNPNEQDIPFMGMTSGPPVYNMHSSQNTPDAGSPRGRFSGFGPAGKLLVSEQVGSVHPHDNRRPNKVLLKQHNGWNRRDEEQKREHAVATNAPYLEKEDHRRTLQENDQVVDCNNAEDMKARATVLGEESSSQTFDDQGISSGQGKEKLPKSMVDAKMVDEISVKKLETVSASSEVPQRFPVQPKDSTLIRKIESLNAKARATDGWHDASSVSYKEDQNNKLDGVNAMANISTTDADACFENCLTSGVVIPDSHAVGADAGDKSFLATAATRTVISRRATNGTQGRFDHCGKANFNTKEVDEWRKKPLLGDSSNVFLAINSGTSSNPHFLDHHISTEATEKILPHLQQKDDGESLTPMFDPTDCQAQHAKMRELARQKAKQLQKEEEERTREQKAKAHAKLEDLNRRTQAVEGFTQKLVDISSDDTVHLKHGEPINVMEPATDASKLGSLTTASVSMPDVSQISESSISTGGESAILSRKLPLETAKNTPEEPVVTHSQSLPTQHDCIKNTADAETARQTHDSVSRQKQAGYKQKQIIPLEKNSAEMLISTSAAEVPRSHTAAVVGASAEVANGEISLTCELSLPINPSDTAESLLYQKRKNNRGGKNKQKLEEASSTAALPLLVRKETRHPKASTGSVKPETFVSKADSSSKQLIDFKDTIQSSEQPPLPGEEGRIRVNNQWKPQHSRRMLRNAKAEKEKLHGGDAVVWAPVRSQNKMEVAVEVSQKTTDETASASTKSDPLVQNNPKAKRAEMERYIPKPVAKELALQVSNQHSSSPCNHMGLDEDTAEVESGAHRTASTEPAIVVVGKVSLAVEARSGEWRQNNQANNSCWQRVSANSTFLESTQDGSPASLGKYVEKPTEHSRTENPGVPLSKEQSKDYDEWNPPEGWNIPPNLESVSLETFPVVIDLGAMSRGKRNSFKGRRGTGNNPESDHKNLNSGGKDKTYTESPAPEMNQMDVKAGSKENRGGGERLTSHWQPKSQASMTQNQWESRSNGGENVTEVVDKVIKESTCQQSKSLGENINLVDYSPAMPGTSVIAEEPTAGYQDTRRVRKAAPYKGRPRSPKHDHVKPIESASSATVEIQQEQRLSSGFHKNGNQNSRFGRGNEFSGEWSSARQENRQHYRPASRERQKHNSHYEYQPVVPQNDSKMNSSEGQTDGSELIRGSRVRDKGESQSRRSGGNFYGHQSWSVRGDSGYG